MSDDMKTMRRKRAADEGEEQPKKVKKLRKYVVRPKHKICVVKGEYAVAGDIITLDSKMAKHFIKHDRISPYVNLDDDA